MGRTRAAIADGVGRCLAARGARRTTMRDIAAAAGVAKGTLYNHVRTRSEAYLLFAEVEVARLCALLGSGESCGTPADRLVAVAEHVATHPVARALAATEPATLIVALSPDLAAAPFHGELRAALGALVGEPSADLVLRWLLTLLVDPGTVEQRTAAIQRLVGVSQLAVGGDEYR